MQSYCVRSMPLKLRLELLPWVSVWRKRHLKWSSLGFSRSSIWVSWVSGLRSSNHLGLHWKELINGCVCCRDNQDENSLMHLESRTFCCRILLGSQTCIQRSFPSVFLVISLVPECLTDVLSGDASRIDYRQFSLGSGFPCSVGSAGPSADRPSQAFWMETQPLLKFFGFSTSFSLGKAFNSWVEPFL